MKRQNLLFTLLLLLTLSVVCGCSGLSAENTKNTDIPLADSNPEESSPGEASRELTEEKASLSEDAVSEDAWEEDSPNASVSSSGPAESITGIFEGLEDNHTALFSFDGAETPFYFEDQEVQTALMEAILGSPYTLSYYTDPELGLNVICQISE